MHYKHIINNLIPADDLHWDEEDQRYVSLSSEETQEIITRCIEEGMADLQDIYKIVQWCGFVRIGQILMKNFLSGSLSVSGFDNEGMPFFGAKRRNDED